MFHQASDPEYPGLFHQSRRTRPCQLKSSKVKGQEIGLLKIQYDAPFAFAGFNLVCAFSRRAQGNMSLFYGDTKDALANRKAFLAALGIDYRDLICATQVHKANVRYIQQVDKGKGALSYDNALPDTDALITDKPNLPLAIFTADCLSVFLYDPKTPAIGLAHAGWRSTQENIIAKTVQLMNEKFNTRAENLYAGFGPAIRSCCYKVGREFSDFFVYGLEQENAHYYLDLAGINKKQLLDSAVREINIFDSGICTSCQNAELFSYRKEGSGCGRTMSVIMLRHS